MKTSSSHHRRWTVLLAALFLIAAPAPGSKEGAVECGVLIYGGTKTSRCFSDEFLSTVQQKTSIATERRFKSVKVASDELFRFPFVIMTGEGSFTLTPKERDFLKRYLSNGGFLLASAGCSSEEWDTAFRREIKRVFEDESLQPVGRDHPIYRTVFPVANLELSKSSGQAKLEGITRNDKLVVIYSADGLNDSYNATGCCCCGGNEISNALEVNANILAYALLH